MCRFSLHNRHKTCPQTVIAGADPQSPAPSYTFTAKTTDYASRFRLVFVANNEGAPSTDSATEETFAYIDASGNIIITDGDAFNASLQMIDMTGRVIRVCTDVARNVSTIGMPAGIYILRLINGDNVQTQKIILK